MLAMNWMPITNSYDVGRGVNKQEDKKNCMKKYNTLVIPRVSFLLFWLTSVVQNLVNINNNKHVLWQPGRKKKTRRPSCGWNTLVNWFVGGGGGVKRGFELIWGVIKKKKRGEITIERETMMIPAHKWWFAGLLRKNWHHSRSSVQAAAAAGLGGGGGVEGAQSMVKVGIGSRDETY